MSTAHANPFKDEKELLDHPITEDPQVPQDLALLEKEMEQLALKQQRLQTLQQDLARQRFQSSLCIKDLFVQLEQERETLWIPFKVLNATGALFEMEKQFHLHAFHDDGRTVKYKLTVACPLNHPCLQDEDIEPRGLLLWKLIDILTLEFVSYSYRQNSLRLC